jgi:spore germination protein GerM
MANGEMGDFNPYVATIRVGSSYSGRATLEVFDNSAKDGSEIDKVRIPLRLHSPGSGRKFLQVYFTNSRLNKSQDCEKVYAIGREEDETAGVAEQALTELLAGPSETERKDGYGSEIPKGTKLRSIKIAGGVATADFSGELNRGGGACHVAAIHAQIENTLRQFPSVKSVVISSEGNSMEALQP